MDEYIPGSMTDEQALATLKSATFTMERGLAKSIFRQGLFEAMCHAVKALEEKVEREYEKHGCMTCKYDIFPITAEPCYSCIHGVCDENPNRTEKWEAEEK